MQYIAVVTREGEQWLAEFPDAPGCQTFAGSENELRAAAAEALEGWLLASIEGGDEIARPRTRAKAPAGASTMAVDVPAAVAAALQLRWLRAEQGLSQSALAKRLGVSQQQVAKLESGEGNPTVETLAKVAAALGARLSVEIVR